MEQVLTKCHAGRISKGAAIDLEIELEGTSRKRRGTCPKDDAFERNSLPCQR
jgi:hypothetical protein